MGEKDISEKILFDYNDVFADIINVCVFDGRENIKPEDLENALVHSQYKAEDGKLHEEERDIAKYWKQKKSAIALYGIENQSEVDYKMPFRIIGYDGASYRSQLLSKTKNIVPVASFVLYFGIENHWTKKRAIKELMQVPKELEPYINDYKINIVEVAWLSDEQLKQFKSDFGIVANFFVQKRRNKNYVPEDTREIQHVDEVLKLLSVMTKDDTYRNMLYQKDKEEEMESKGEVKTMCDVAERLKNMGKKEGLREGLQKGLCEGRREELLRQTEAKLAKGKTNEQIADELELTMEETKELIKVFSDKQARRWKTS